MPRLVLQPYVDEADSKPLLSSCVHVRYSGQLFSTMESSKADQADSREKNRKLAVGGVGFPASNPPLRVDVWLYSDSLVL